MFILRHCHYFLSLELFSKDIHMPTPLAYGKLWLKYYFLIKPTLSTLYTAENISSPTPSIPDTHSLFFSKHASLICILFIYLLGLIVYTLSLLHKFHKRWFMDFFYVYSKHVDTMRYKAISQALLKRAWNKYVLVYNWWMK